MRKDFANLPFTFPSLSAAEKNQRKKKDTTDRVTDDQAPVETFSRKVGGEIYLILL